MSERNSTPSPISASRLDEVGGHDDLTEDLDLGLDGAEDILRAWRRGMRPDPDLTVSEWADQHRWLSSRASAEPGRYRTARTPYLREIMDALSPRHPAQRISFMKAAQVGATEAGNNWIGFVIHHAPGPMLAVLPTVEMANPFDAGGYSLAEMTQAINILPNLYTRLGQIGLFRFEGVTQRSIVIEQYQGVLSLLPSVPLGAPATVGTREGRSMRSFALPWIPHDDVILPSDIQGQPLTQPIRWSR